LHQSVRVRLRERPALTAVCVERRVGVAVEPRLADLEQRLPDLNERREAALNDGFELGEPRCYEHAAHAAHLAANGGSACRPGGAFERAEVLVRRVRMARPRFRRTRPSVYGVWPRGVRVCPRTNPGRAVTRTIARAPLTVALRLCVGFTASGIASF